MAPGAGRVLSLRAAAAAVLVLLVLLNLAMTRWLEGGWEVVVAAVGTVALLGLARVAGLSWDELGLGRAAAGRGLRWAAVIVGAVALGYVVVLGLPGLDEVLVDERTPTTMADAALEAFVVIPARTVLLEEVAFRGVLWGLLAKASGPRVATGVSSLVFGVWHVLPATGFAASNQAAGDVLGRSAGATAVVVVGTVLVTGVAGLLLAELRRRSGSLLAPIGLHWAANGLGTLASAFAAR